MRKNNWQPGLQPTVEVAALYVKVFAQRGKWMEEAKGWEPMALQEQP